VTPVDADGETGTTFSYQNSRMGALTRPLWNVPTQPLSGCETSTRGTEFGPRAFDHPLYVADQLAPRFTVRPQPVEHRLAGGEKKSQNTPLLLTADACTCAFTVGTKRCATLARVDQREKRMAQNEALFREINERVQSTADELEIEDAREFFCECANADCSFLLKLTRSQYENVRADPTQFVVLPLHFTPEVETMVGEYEGYWLVRKTGEAGDYVESMDPRSG
jgi:hypothetical protein